MIRFFTRRIVNDILVCQIANSVRGSTIRVCFPGKQKIWLCLWLAAFAPSIVTDVSYVKDISNESYVLGTRLLGCALSLTLHMLRKSLMTMKFEE